MHRSARGALALMLLLIAPSARAQAPVPSGFVDAATVVDGLVLDMRYFSENNFVGEKIDGYERPRCLLSAQAANALAGVQRDLAARGLGLKVFDCYRPQRAVAHFVRWARKIDDVRRKAEFYPEDRQARSVQGGLHLRALRSLARRDPRSHAGAACGRKRARYGRAVRLLQPEIMAVGQERKRAGAKEPRAVGGGDDARRV